MYYGQLENNQYNRSSGLGGHFNLVQWDYLAVISKKGWSVQKVFTMERFDIRYALAEVTREKRFVESCNEHQRKYSLLRRTWRLVL